MVKFLVVVLAICCIVASIAFGLDSRQDNRSTDALITNTQAVITLAESQGALVKSINGLSGEITNLSQSVDQRFGEVDQRLSSLARDVALIKHGQLVGGQGAGGAPIIVVVPGQSQPSNAQPIFVTQ